MNKRLIKALIKILIWIGTIAGISFLNVCLFLVFRFYFDDPTITIILITVIANKLSQKYDETRNNREFRNFIPSYIQNSSRKNETRLLKKADKFLKERRNSLETINIQIENDNKTLISNSTYLETDIKRYSVSDDVAREEKEKLKEVKNKLTTLNDQLVDISNKIWRKANEIESEHKSLDRLNQLLTEIISMLEERIILLNGITNLLNEKKAILSLIQKAVKSNYDSLKNADKNDIFERAIESGISIDMGVEAYKECMNTVNDEKCTMKATISKNSNEPKTSENINELNSNINELLKEKVRLLEEINQHLAEENNIIKKNKNNKKKHIFKVNKIFNIKNILFVLCAILLIALISTWIFYYNNVYSIKNTYVDKYDLKNTDIVYVARGNIYHKRTCNEVSNFNLTKYTVEEAKEEGYRPCVMCIAKDKATVYIVSGGLHYHRNNCRLINTDNLIGISLEEAETKNYKPCQTCFS